MNRLLRPLNSSAVMAGSLLCWMILLASLLPAPQAVAQPAYPVRMKIELLSIRNRSASPIPVQIRLEYNQPQILQGTLELSLHDALDVVSDEGLLATMKMEDIVLSGSDYMFQTILPPLQTSGIQNLAVIGWFQTEKERIPLSSSLKEVNPPLPHDLLMISPSDRSTLICSCTGGTVFQNPSANRLFLDRMLSLENYNPLRDADGVDPDQRSRRNTRSFGRNIQYYSVSWSSRDLPEDPLTYCCFDLVLLVDGALAKLTAEQMTALRTWIRAGGSLCIVPDAPMRPQHLQFVRDLFESADEQSGMTDFSLDDNGQLLTIAHTVDRPILAGYGLGRVALLPAVDDLSSLLDAAERGRVTAHLWKVLRNSPVWKGQPWRAEDLVDMLQRQGFRAGRDERGLFYMEDQYPGISGTPRRNYYSEESIRAGYSVDERLAPGSSPLLAVASEALIPADVEMIPTWVIGLILTAYVLTIGPVDYLVLGYLRLRKATWVVFPIVTALFTVLTIWIAHRYMGSTETGGYLEIIDLVDNGEPVRRTRLDMLFYGSRTVHASEHRQQLIVPVIDHSPVAAQMNLDAMGHRPLSAPVLNYAGHFPAAYSVTQTIQQWTPQLVRTFELAPENVELPSGIDWADPLLVSTDEGRRTLRDQLQQLSQNLGSSFSVSAVIAHQQQQFPIRNNSVWADPTEKWDQPSRLFRRRRFGSYESLHRTLLLATVDPTRTDLFRIVSQVSPQGSGLLEDLPLLDPEDDRQWVLIVILEEDNEFRVFRRLYWINPE